MADDEPQNRENKHSRVDDPVHDTTRPISITTSDPVIGSAVEHQTDWKKYPDSTVRTETTQVSETSPLYLPGVRTVVTEDRPRREGGEPGDRGQSDDKEQEDRGKKQNAQGKKRDDQSNGQPKKPDQEEQDRGDEDQRGERDDRQDKPRQKQPSMMKNLLITGGVALVFGVLGAMGYSYFFGSKSGGSSSEQSKGKSESGSKKESSSKKSSGGGSGKESGKESNAQAATSSSIPGFTSAEDADTLKRQIMDLMQRVDRLGERVDRMSRPKDETPPVLHTLQIKVRELAREMDDLASLPAQVRHYDNRLETLQEDLKTLRARIESMQGGSVAGTTPGVTLPSGKSAHGSVGESGSSTNPTLDLGIGLLERGEYATAREIFLRLQAAQPDDARVWYLSALAEGLTKGNWQGEPQRLAEKGLECERAGNPPTADIDAALATHTPIKGEDWIASLRRRVLSVR